MPNSNQVIRQQIVQSVAAPATNIENQIASSLIHYGEYCGQISSHDLGVILKKVLYTLVAEQKVAGFEVPLVHNVSQMDIKIADCEALIRSEVHVHAPVTAFIRFKYTLENVPGAPRLRLKKNSLQVEEITKPFDFAAKVALRVMDVERIARHELSDPAAVILRTLPEQLLHYGYDGLVSVIDLQFLKDNSLSVFMKALRRHKAGQGD